MMPSDYESRTRTTLGAFEITVSFQMPTSKAHILAGGDALPADFYKHGASPTQAQRLMSQPEGRMDDRANSVGHEQAKNLVQRSMAFRPSTQRSAARRRRPVKHSLRYIHRQFQATGNPKTAGFPATLVESTPTRILESGDRNAIPPLLL
ncbi:hypothetical protein BKM17_04705 [Pseudomonas syringae group genomosp. 3]|nr:hypothetical protein BKM17_04705 [Pseudomonas syringae group genomosp. 3]